MANRFVATPMEFEYDNKTGLVDSDSAWLKSLTPQKQAGFRTPTFNPSFGLQKQPSPTRVLANPNPQTPVYKQPPRMAFHGIRDTPTQDFSSGPENQSSPENADNEDTPEPLKIASKLQINDNVTVVRPRKTPGKRRSFFDSFNLARLSPARSGLRKRQDKDALARRGYKRKRQENDTENRIERRRPSDESGSDTKSGRDHSVKPVPQEAFMITLLHTVMKYPTLPFQLLTYAQLLFNMFILFLVAWIIWTFYLVIRQDLNMKAEHEILMAMSEVTLCSSHFHNNKCDMGNRVPAMESLCHDWAHCMARDPGAIGRAKIGANAFGEIYSSLIDPISNKALVLTLTVITLVWVIPNIAFVVAKFKIPDATSEPAHDQGPFQHDQVRHNSNSGFMLRSENYSKDLVPLNRNGSRSPSKNHDY
ncbi:hypothetical protein MMC26_000525 [Xylographa opegraphella]|nr:hypothetical protein [Xylographa opegraphella]